MTLLLAQNRELITQMQKLMIQIQDKHKKENPDNSVENWLLSDLSPNAYILSSSRQDSSGGLGTLNMDFSSEIFDNSNVGSTPIRTNPATSNKNSLTFEDIASRNFSNLNTADSTSTGSSTNNPFTPTTMTNDVYKFTFDTSLNSSKHSNENNVTLLKRTETTIT